MEENKERKISFFTRVKWAIFNVENYDFFATEKPTKAIGYFLKLILVFSLLISLAVTYQFSKLYQGVIHYLETEFPDFTYQDGTLQVQQTESIVQESEQGIAIIDTIDTENSEQIEKLKSYSNGILLLKDKAIIKLEISEEVAEYSYQELAEMFQIEQTTKTEMLETLKKLPSTTIYATFYLSAVVYLFLIYAIVIGMDVLLLSILGMLTARMARLKLRYAPVANMSVYALTLSVLLNAIYIVAYLLTGFEIRYFQIMYNIISYIYLVTAILMIKSEMIKQEMELMKLAEEQKKVKEELERQEEERKEKEEQKKKEKEKEEKEKKEKQQEEAPEGSQAMQEKDGEGYSS